MTKTKTRILSVISIVALLAVIALNLVSCGSNADEGKVTVTIEITDNNGEKTSKEYSSSAATLADLLKENNLVEGEDSAYGFYITAVNGIVADYNTDGAYWALYKNGEYMTTGADGETLEAGAVYGLVYTKG